MSHTSFERRGIEGEQMDVRRTYVIRVKEQNLSPWRLEHSNSFQVVISGDQHIKGRCRNEQWVHIKSDS